MAGRAKCLSLLLDKGADPNSADRNGTPEVTLATMHGRAKCLSLLLDSGADPNIAMDNGSTALMYAAFSGDTDCAELLLRHEAQVDAIGTIRQRRGTALLHCGITMSSPYHGNNPLHVGRQQRSDAMALALLEYGADPDHQDISCDRARYVMDPERLRDRLEERDRAVKAAFIASSIMSAKCGDDVGSLFASFLAIPWMLTQIQNLNAAVVASSIMSDKFGDVGNLITSFLVTPWMYSHIQRLNAAARATAQEPLAGQTGDDTTVEEPANGVEEPANDVEEPGNGGEEPVNDRRRLAPDNAHVPDPHQ